MFERFILTLAEITLITGISPAKLHYDVKSEKLPSRLIAGKRRVLVKDLEAYLGQTLSGLPLQVK